MFRQLCWMQHLKDYQCLGSQLGCTAPKGLPMFRQLCKMQHLKDYQCLGCCEDVAPELITNVQVAIWDEASKRLPMFRQLYVMSHLKDYQWQLLLSETQRLFRYKPNCKILTILHILGANLVILVQNMISLGQKQQGFNCIYLDNLHNSDFNREIHLSFNHFCNWLKKKQFY